MFKALQNSAKKLNDELAKAQEALDTAAKAEKAKSDEQLAKIAALEKEKEGRAGEFAKLEAEKKGLQEKLDASQKSLDEAQKKNKQLETETAKVQTEFTHQETVLNGMKVANTNNKKLAEEAKLESEGLNTQLSEKTQQAERLTTQIAALRDLNKLLTQKNSELREKVKTTLSTTEASASSSSTVVTLKNSENNRANSPTQELEFFRTASLDELIAHVRNPETTSFPKTSEGRSIFFPLSKRPFQANDLEKLTTLVRAIREKDPAIFKTSAQESNPFFTAIIGPQPLLFQALQGCVDAKEKNRAGQSLLAFACFQPVYTNPNVLWMPNAEIITTLIQNTMDVKEFTHPYNFQGIGFVSAQNLIKDLAAKYPRHGGYAAAQKTMEARITSLTSKTAPLPPQPTMLPALVLAPQTSATTTATTSSQLPRVSRIEPTSQHNTRFFKLAAKRKSDESSAATALSALSNGQNTDVDVATQVEKRVTTEANAPK